MRHRNQNTQNMIDALGTLRGQIADLEAKEASLCEAIIRMGQGSHEGRVFRATVIKGERPQIDLEAVRRHVAPRWLRAHTKKISFTQVRVSAR